MIHGLANLLIESVHLQLGIRKWGRSKIIFLSILPMRKRAEIIHEILEKRFETVLPMAMRKTGYDMWIVVCQEDDLDPSFIICARLTS